MPELNSWSLSVNYRLIAILILFCSVNFLACVSDDTNIGAKNYSRPLGPGENALELVTDPALYPNFQLMWSDQRGLAEAIEHSLNYMKKPSSKTHYPLMQFEHEHVVQSLLFMKGLLGSAQSADEFAGFCSANFDIYRSVGWDKEGSVLFTAYYQPIFDGRRVADAEYQFPLYTLPSDLVKAKDGTALGRQNGESIVGYWTREEMHSQGLLHNRGLELVWLKSALDAYIVHVQGSARIRLENDEMMHIGYAGKTEHSYVSLGGELVKDGKIANEEISLAKIREWFLQHPEEETEYLNRNPSFIFFTETDGGGPYGSLNATVTAYRSIATDKSIFPRAALCAVETTVPKLASDGRLTPQKFSSLVLDQDTGGAIRSAGRCDLFVGVGEAAEQIAGHTKYEGQLFYLFLKKDRLR